MTAKKCRSKRGQPERGGGEVVAVHVEGRVVGVLVVREEVLRVCVCMLTGQNGQILVETRAGSPVREEVLWRQCVCVCA